MGQKVNPNGLRIGIIKSWPSTWFAEGEAFRSQFLQDVLACACGGRRTVIALVSDRKIVAEILEHLGLPTTGPPVAPARVASSCIDSPWQDDVPALQRSLR